MIITDWRRIADVANLGHTDAVYFAQCRAQVASLRHRVAMEMLRREGWPPQAAENELAVHGLGTRAPETRNDIMLSIVAELT